MFFDGQHGLVAGGVEDEDVDGAEDGGDVGDQLSNGGWVADVGGKGVGGEALGAKVGAEGFGAGGTREVVDGDVVARFGRGRWPWRRRVRGRHR